ncbi:complement decay-accelerating factor-like isoform X2 [Chiloscyllium plagiosum]|uniref:complement decay-accelerating factor-like isoform X2 n=1 Tax=Chiloscyllium plagiosum TaxID=36176 RepID=UPI001CB82BAB|nr:complement decay-accelerating factor-like isoform X2 [Chiloscyllium plagiosum]
MFKKRKDCEMSERLILCVMAIGVARVTGDCGRPPRLNNGSPTDAFLAMSSFPSGTKVTYKCYSGYTFTSGSRRFSTCKPDSTWTTLRSTCEKISCGNPGEIQDGYYEASDVTFGSKATFYCDPGYQLVGRPYRLCKASGWDGQVPTCDLVNCADPPSIHNGKVSSLPFGDNWNYGMVAKYSCNAEYALIGVKELTCTANGQWDKNPPECKGA